MTQIPRNSRSADGSYLQGIVVMMCGVLPLPAIDAVGKYLTTTGHMAPGQVSFYRFFFQFVVTVPLLIYIGGVASLQPRRWVPNLLRGVLLAGASLCLYIAVQHMPLADVIAIFFVEPFILTALSAIVLREKVGWPQWLAIVTGFVGASIVINPSFKRIGVVALFPVATAALFACYMLLNRALGKSDSPLVMQYAAGIGGSLFMALVLAGGSITGLATLQPSLPASGLAWVLLVAAGLVSAYSHWLIVHAFQTAPASILAPFQYFEIISATTLGYFIFGDFPTPSKWTGIAIIVSSGLFILWREQHE